MPALDRAENAAMLDASVIRDNLVRCDRLPLVLRVPSLQEGAPASR